jgi:hypothetical protein
MVMSMMKTGNGFVSNHFNLTTFYWRVHFQDIECNRVGAKGFLVPASQKKKKKGEDSDEEASEESPSEKKSNKRARAKKEDDADADAGAEPPAKKAKGRPKKAVIKENPDDAAGSIGEQDDAAPKKKAAPKSRAKKVEAVEVDDEELVVEKPKTKKKAAPRKKKEVVEDDDGEEDPQRAEKPKPRKKAAPRKKKEAVEDEEDEEEPEVIAKPKGRKAPASRGKKKEVEEVSLTNGKLQNQGLTCYRSSKPLIATASEYFPTCSAQLETKTKPTLNQDDTQLLPQHVCAVCTTWPQHDPKDVQEADFSSEDTRGGLERCLKSMNVRAEHQYRVLEYPVEMYYYHRSKISFQQQTTAFSHLPLKSPLPSFALYLKVDQSRCANFMSHP